MSTNQKSRPRHKHANKNKHEWGYSEEDGPEFWSKHFPAGRGHHQSPIDFDTASQHIKYDSSLGSIVVNYERCEALAIWNTGNTFQVKFNKNAPAILTKGPFKNDQYQLTQMHGHWGSANAEHGSEHTINGRSFPSELHFVHYNKKYGSVEKAAHHHDGLAVIAVFLKVSEKANEELQKLIEDFKLIDYDNHDVSLDFSLHPREFLPADGLGRYFTYLGSLTTPPLSECVVWVVMVDPLEVSSEQLKQFHKLHSSSDGHLIDHNFRPVQPINNRLVKASFEDFKSCSAPIEN